MLHIYTTTTTTSKAPLRLETAEKKKRKKNELLYRMHYLPGIPVYLGTSKILNARERERAKNRVLPSFILYRRKLHWRVKHTAVPSQKEKEKKNKNFPAAGVVQAPAVLIISAGRVAVVVVRSECQPAHLDKSKIQAPAIDACPPGIRFSC